MSVANEVCKFILYGFLLYVVLNQTPLLEAFTKKQMKSNSYVDNFTSFDPNQFLASRLCA